MLSIKTQKVLMFIPIVNMINVIMWTIAVITHPTKFKTYIMSLLKSFGLIIAINIPKLIISYLVDSAIIQNIATFGSIYLCFFVFSYIAVKAQIQMENDRKDNN